MEYSSIITLIKYFFFLIFFQVPNLPLQIPPDNTTNRPPFCLHQSKFAEQQNQLTRGKSTSK